MLTATHYQQISVEVEKISGDGTGTVHILPNQLLNTKNAPMGILTFNTSVKIYPNSSASFPSQVVTYSPSYVTLYGKACGIGNLFYLLLTLINSFKEHLEIGGTWEFGLGGSTCEGHSSNYTFESVAVLNSGRLVNNET